LNWTRNLRLSVQALWRARFRTLMSASGMTIGIAALVLLFGMGSGAEQALQAALEKMGKNLLSVGAERKESGALRGQSTRYDTLTLEDWRAINEELASVERAAPIAMNNYQMRYGGESMTATAVGTSPEYRVTNNHDVSAGRFFDEFDVMDARRVALVGAEVARRLFRGEQPLGERLLVGGVPFLIIGILEEKGIDVTGSAQDDKILVPITTAQRRLLNVDSIDRIFVQAASRDLVETALEDVRQLLRSRHGLDDLSSADDFTIRSQASMVRTMRLTDMVFTRLLGGTATLTLALASVGLLAVSLLSVRERQGEIGLRRAVGARPVQVMTQFLSEAVMTALLGGCLGLLIGAAGIILGQWLMGWRMALVANDLVIAMSIPLGLALLAGAYPAWRAAILDPIVALRTV
jgi:putative ABC transport system permease protein